jgi:hypothetical protein
VNRNGGRRWEELDVKTCGFGMREAIFDAGTDFVVPSLNWMRYCGEVVGSIGMRDDHDSARPKDGVIA